MVEDEESKARRNVMAVSTLIVLAWWLQAPLDKISEKLLGMPSVGPAFEWRAWFAAVAALAYFGLRFRFSAEHSKAVDELKTEFRSTLLRLLRRWLQWEMTWFARWGWTPPVLGDGFATVVQPYRTMADGTPLRIVDIYVTEVRLGVQSSSGEYVEPTDGAVLGNVLLHVRRTTAGGHSDEFRVAGVGFELNPLQRRLLKGWTAAAMFLYSKASTAVFVPWALSCAAAVICLIRLVRAW